MKIKLNEVPFSASGSYLALGWMDSGFHGWSNEKGLYLRSVHVKGGNSAGPDTLVARLIPFHDGLAVEHTVEATPDHMTIRTEYGTIRIVFDDECTLLFEGTGDLSLTMDFNPLTSGAFNLIEQWQDGDRVWYMANIYRTSGRYMLYAQEGCPVVDQKWTGETTGAATYTVNSENGRFLLVLEEVVDSWKDKGKFYDADQAQAAREADFRAFCKKMPSMPEAYREVGEYASYVNWSSIIAPCGLFQRYAMYMSKNWMTSVWSWDHCFNAIASAYGDPQMAWDQFMVMFDHQRPSGMIPDSINVSVLLENYCKPPIHGWAYRKMKAIMPVSAEQKQEVYEKLSKWTEWWLNYRDPNGDGLCEYTHGNDSGWDNSTAFIQAPPMTLPDLAAFLVLQMEELSDLAKELGKEEEASCWEAESEAMLGRMLDKLFVDSRPVARRAFTDEIVENKSLILCLPILLGKRLPDAVRTSILTYLKEFETDWGYATEQPSSPLYASDGYWRGPIWAPSTMLIVDGLESSGEHDLAVRIARQFCDMVKESGCAENFDALTGGGLRDRAYTWTASVMLVLAHEYLMDQ